MNWLKGATFPVAPAQTYLALFTATPTDAGGGTECSYSGYARQACPFGALSVQSPTGTLMLNSGTINFAGNPAAMTIVAVGIFDAATGGNLLEYATGLSLTFSASQPPYLSSGDVQKLED